MSRSSRIESSRRHSKRQAFTFIARGRTIAKHLSLDIHPMLSISCSASRALTQAQTALSSVSLFHPLAMSPTPSSATSSRRNKGRASLLTPIATLALTAQRSVQGRQENRRACAFKDSSITASALPRCNSCQLARHTTPSEPSPFSTALHGPTDQSPESEAHRRTQTVPEAFTK